MNIGIIGHFGGKNKFNDGQTVKTKNIYNALLNSGITSVDMIDTYYIKKNPVEFFLALIKSLAKDKKYIVFKICREYGGKLSECIFRCRKQKFIVPRS